MRREERIGLIVLIVLVLASIGNTLVDNRDEEFDPETCDEWYQQIHGDTPNRSQTFEDPKYYVAIIQEGIPHYLVVKDENDDCSSGYAEVLCNCYSWHEKAEETPAQLIIEEYEWMYEGWTVEDKIFQDCLENYRIFIYEKRHLDMIREDEEYREAVLAYDPNSEICLK